MDELVRRLREKAGAFDYDGRPDIACDYEQAAVANKPRWIPVEERLPEIDPEHHCSKDVIVRVEGGGYMFSALEENIFGQAWFECERMSPSGDDGYTVTHWMPLLQAPKEET